jgi:glycosyltransferase involved in cell wall biosynthesis
MRVVRAIDAVARAQSIRLIHAHMSDSAPWAVLVARRSRIPVVVSVHSNHLLPYTLRSRPTRRRARMALLGWALRSADRIVAVSPTVRETVTRTLGIDGDRVTVVTNGIRIGRTAGVGASAVRRELGIPRHAHVVTCIGRLVVNKGQQALIAMLPRLCELDPTAHLLLVGDGPAAAVLRYDAARLGMARTVTFAGERTDVEAILAASDVFASASLFEGVSLALLEAMAAGVPVVARDTPGNREVLAGGAGLLIEDESPARLAAGVGRVLTDPDLKVQLARVARHRLRERYTVERAVAETATLYRELLPPWSQIAEGARS